MKTFQELYEVMSVAGRKKLARRMAKLQKSPAFQMKKKKAALRMRDSTKLLMIARKKAIQFFRDKFYPDYARKSMQQKVKIDQKIMLKYAGGINKISKREAIKLKTKEMERIKKARDAMGKDTDA